jgi:hypothetical protein
LAAVFINRVEVLAMRIEHLFQRFRQILHEMEAIRHLYRVRRPLPNARTIGFRAVSCDHVDLGMRLEPGGHGLGQSILQYVNGTTPL